MARKRKRVQITRTLEVEGVDYSRQHGVTCPGRPGRPCGYTRPRTVTTRPWRDGIRVRYHLCTWCGATFKSIETDPEYRPAPAAAEG